jgi:hypothetical protein
MADEIGKATGRKAPVLMYIGDSMTDLECLLEADIGVVMCSSIPDSSLCNTFTKYNKTPVHIGKPGKNLKGIFWARDFKEIVSALSSTKKG